MSCFDFVLYPLLALKHDLVKVKDFNKLIIIPLICHLDQPFSYFGK